MTSTPTLLKWESPPGGERSGGGGGGGGAHMVKTTVTVKVWFPIIANILKDTAVNCYTSDSLLSPYIHCNFVILAAPPPTKMASETLNRCWNMCKVLNSTTNIRLELPWRRLLESIVSILTFPKLHSATDKELTLHAVIFSSWVSNTIIYQLHCPVWLFMV